MVRSLLELPLELLEEVFSFLESDKEAISSCRLTCSTFKERSSPFLITKVVFAKRFKVITRFQDIIEHPYFHKHVTELVYDASWFHGGPAESWSEYAEACRSAPQTFNDSEGLVRLRRDDFAFGSIVRRTTTRPPAEVQLSCGTDDEALRHSNTREDMGAYFLGCHSSFPDYQMLSRAEERIQYANLGKHIMMDAFVKLPKLKSVLITDWRGLVKPGESYSECASRLFGNTLAPEHMNADRGEYSCFYEIASAALDVPGAHIKTFAIGPHPFEHAEVHDRDKHHDAQHAQYLPSDLLKLFGIPTTQALFSGLRRLRLPLEFPNKVIRSQSPDALIMRDVLARCSNLTHLTLCSQRPLRIDSSVITMSTSQLIAVLSDWHFPNLRSLDLRQWILAEDHLKEVLGRHSATIRELRLLLCLLLRGDERNLAEWGGRNLHLEGIELGHQRSLTPVILEDLRVVEGSLKPLTGEWEQLWLHGKENQIKREPAPMPLNKNDDTLWYLKHTKSQRGSWP